tara:strand:+ start:3928 stop:7062 length:3135 start_codon:yes stop_codon:yes gene_type:complete
MATSNIASSETYTDPDALLISTTAVVIASGLVTLTVDKMTDIAKGDFINVSNIPTSTSLSAANGRFCIAIDGAGVPENTSGVRKIHYQIPGDTATNGTLAAVPEGRAIIEETYKDTTDALDGMAFDNATHTITKLGGTNWDATELGQGSVITVDGSEFNDGTYTVAATPVALVLTLVDDDVLTTDPADNVADISVYTPNGVFKTSDIYMNAISKLFYFRALGTVRGSTAAATPGLGSFQTAGSGIVGQALYSFFKFIWKAVEPLPKFDFPMLSITNEQFEFINSWYPDNSVSITQESRVDPTAAGLTLDTATFTTTDADIDFRRFQALRDATASDSVGVSGGNAFVKTDHTITTVTKDTITLDPVPVDPTVEPVFYTDFVANTVELIRTAGFTVRDATNNYTKSTYSGIVTLGTTVDSTDQQYYIQDSSSTAYVTNAAYTSTLNQPVLVSSQANSQLVGSGGNGQTDIVFTALVADTAGGSVITPTATDVVNDVDGVLTATVVTTAFDTLAVGDVIEVTGYVGADIGNNGYWEITAQASGVISVKATDGVSVITADAAVPGTGVIAIIEEATITSTAAKTDLSVFDYLSTITVTETSSNNSTFTVIGAVSSTKIVVTGSTAVQDELTPQGCVITAVKTSNFTMFLRERKKSYGQSALSDIGVTTLTYIVYRFPVTNANDINIVTTADTDIQSPYTGKVPANQIPPSGGNLSEIRLEYIPTFDAVGAAIAGTSVQIKGDLVSGTDYEIGDVIYDAAGTIPRWYYSKATRQAGAATVLADGNTTNWAAWDIAAGGGERNISGAYKAFDTIVNADVGITPSGAGPYVDGASKNSVTAVYEWTQWALRLPLTVNSDKADAIATGSDIRHGNIQNLLVDFVGSNLVTRQGVFIDSIPDLDQNNITFTDYANVGSLVYPTVVTVTISFNDNLVNDSNAVFYQYYTNLNGANADFGQPNAVQVNRSNETKVGSDVSPLPNGIPSIGTYTYQYNYSQDDAGGLKPQGTDTGVTTVAIGLDTGQYVKSSDTITVGGGTISLVAPVERNYDNQA